MGIFSRVSELYNDMWRAIIRPPRDQYTIEQLGPSEFLFKTQRYRRRDFDLLNDRGLRIECSHFEPVDRNGQYSMTPYPCVIYLHGNCSSRLEAVHCGCLRVLLPLSISVLCFDFSGSGLSEGEYVSLGWHERDDLRHIVAHLRGLGRVSTIGLWGRSMGAVTACMFVDDDPSIAGLVVDSPFSSLRRLAEELAGDFVGWKVPKLILQPALSMVRSTIQAKAEFDLDNVEPIRHCKSSFAPALFIAAKDDCFIRPHHAKNMHDVYAGDKNFILVEGNHNTTRPEFLHDSITFFFRFSLRLDTVSPDAALSATVWDDIATSLALLERNRRHRITRELAESGQQKAAPSRQTPADSTSRTGPKKRKGCKSNAKPPGKEECSQSSGQNNTEPATVARSRSPLVTSLSAAVSESEPSTTEKGTSQLAAAGQQTLIRAESDIWDAAGLDGSSDDVMFTTEGQIILMESAQQHPLLPLSSNGHRPSSVLRAGPKHVDLPDLPESDLDELIEEFTGHTRPPQNTIHHDSVGDRPMSSTRKVLKGNASSGTSGGSTTSCTANNTHWPFSDSTDTNTPTLWTSTESHGPSSRRNIGGGSRAEAPAGRRVLLGDSQGTLVSRPPISKKPVQETNGWFSDTFQMRPPDRERAINGS